MPRMTAGKRSELESFWRAHLDGWRRSDLNQREYCELHGLPLTRFGNWRAKLKYEEPAVPAPASHIPSTRSTPPGKRRRFSEADKRRIVEEADRPGASASDVARRHGIAVRQLFRWKQELAPAATTETTFLPVTIADAPDRSAEAPASPPGPAPAIVERSAPGIEIQLIGGRRVRFERDVDPETLRRLVSLLEGAAR